MKMCVSLIAVIFLLKGLVFSQDDTGIRNRLIGAWKLVSAEYTMKDGSKRPYPEFGPNAKGFLMYSGDGYMCAQLVNPDLPKWADSAHPTLTSGSPLLTGPLRTADAMNWTCQTNRLSICPK